MNFFGKYGIRLMKSPQIFLDLSVYWYIQNWQKKGAPFYIAALNFF